MNYLVIFYICLVFAYPASAYEQHLLFRSARASEPKLEKLCGLQLIRRLQHVCNACIKPSGAVLIPLTRKRDISNRPSISDQCCTKGLCSRDYLRRYCCDAEEEEE